MRKYVLAMMGSFCVSPYDVLSVQVLSLFISVFRIQTFDVKSNKQKTFFLD